MISSPSSSTTVVVPSSPGYVWEWRPERGDWLLCWQAVPGVYSPPYLHPGIVRQWVGIPPVLAGHMGRVIGREGRFFKHISDMTGAPYIWFRADVFVMEVWGTPEQVAAAFRRIQIHLAKMVGTVQMGNVLHSGACNAPAGMQGGNGSATVMPSAF